MKKKVHRKNLGPLLYKVWVAMGIFSIFLGYKAFASENSVIPLAVAALFAGAVYESERIVGNWGEIVKAAVAALFVSFLGLIPFKNERDYNVDAHLIFCAGGFLIMYSAIILYWYDREIQPKLTEGITFIQSIAIVYWVIDHGFHSSDSLFLKIAIGAGLLFAGFTFLNVFTHLRLTNMFRFLLSFWSSIIMMLFAVENIIRLLRSDAAITGSISWGSLIIVTQYFILGVSSLYIILNMQMIFGYLPSKGDKKGEHRKRVKALTSDHINRFSSEQVSIFHSLICLLLVSAWFGLNYTYEFVERNIAIWLVFILVPLAIQVIDRNGQSLTTTER